jgi:hypothetical protein
MKNKIENNIIIKNAKIFIHLKSAHGLSSLLKYNFQYFKLVIQNADYREFKIKKKSGGYRTIEAPNEYLMQLQKKLNIYLQALYCKIKPDASYGFVLSYKEERETAKSTWSKSSRY